MCCQFHHGQYSIIWPLLLAATLCPSYRWLVNADRPAACWCQGADLVDRAPRVSLQKSQCSVKTPGRPCFKKNSIQIFLRANRFTATTWVPIQLHLAARLRLSTGARPNGSQMDTRLDRSVMWRSSSRPVVVVVVVVPLLLQLVVLGRLRLKPH